MRISLKSALPLVFSGIFIVSLYSCGGGEKDKDKDKEKDKDNYAQTSDCECEKSWFPHSKTSNPKEGEDSPFAAKSTTNCLFHQWSWQKFLWLTKPSGKDGLPNFLQKDGEAELTQIDASMATVTIPEGANVLLDDSLQAGSSGVLRTASKYTGTSYTVYYAIYANKTMLDAAKAFKPKIATSNQSTNDDTFPNGSLELKTSWVQAGAIPEGERGKYFITKASINGRKPEDVAFLGMHVVGRVINHPEFIWATFEHDGMAPNFDWKNTTNAQDAPVKASANMLLFNAPETQGLGGITVPDAGKPPKPVYPDSSGKAYTLYQYGVPKVAGGDFMTAGGDSLRQSGEQEYKNIKTINACVKKNLDDVWANYYYNGSIWLNMDGTTLKQQTDRIVAQGGNLGVVGTDTLLRGSLAAFNISMETYVQADASSGATAHSMKMGDLTNCFGCHASTHKGKSSPLFVSHVFNNYVSSSDKTTIKDAKANGTRAYVELLQRRGQAKKK